MAKERLKKVKTGKAKPGAGKPQPAWRMVSISLVAIAAGALVAKAIGADSGKGVIEAGAVLVAWAGLLVAAEKRLTASLGMGLLILSMMLVAWATSGNGVAAGLVTGLIMFLSALAARQTGKMSTVGSIAGTIYFLFAVLGIVRGLSATEAAQTSLVGFLVGFTLILILHFMELTVFPRLIEPRKQSGKASKDNKAAVTRFFERGPGMRYALARGILLGIGMGLYQANGNSNVFWVMIAVWVVLQPAPLATWDKAIRRGIGTLVGCLAVGAVAYFVSGEALTLIAFGLFLVGLAYYPVDYRIFITTMSFLVVTIYGGATEQGIIHWGLLRILDNAIGIAIAFLAAYWVLPGRGWPHLPKLVRVRRPGPELAPTSDGIRGLPRGDVDQHEEGRRSEQVRPAHAHLRVDGDDELPRDPASLEKEGTSTYETDGPDRPPLSHVSE